MQKLTRNDLLSLEHYQQQRDILRQKIIAYKAQRRVALGPNATVYFEDRETMQWQIQEMIYIEKMIDVAAIEEELSVYNALIPDGDNWKATFMLEYPDEATRKVALQQLVGIENQLWVDINAKERIYAIADEDLERQDGDKTSAVHFVRFQFEPQQITAIKNNAKLKLGVSHPLYNFVVEINLALRQSLEAILIL